jgi:hypothetical protein
MTKFRIDYRDSAAYTHGKVMVEASTWRLDDHEAWFDFYDNAEVIIFTVNASEVLSIYQVPETI